MHQQHSWFRKGDSPRLISIRSKTCSTRIEGCSICSYTVRSLLCQRRTQLTAGYTIEGIIREDTRDIGRLGPDEEHDSRSEGEEDQGVDGTDFLSGNEGKDSTENGAPVTYCQAVSQLDPDYSQKGEGDLRIVRQGGIESIRSCVGHAKSQGTVDCQ